MSSLNQPTIKAHQIYFEPGQLPGLDSSFVPYDNCDNPHPELREYYVFKQAYEHSLIERADYTGIVSWTFFQKAGVLGKNFLILCKVIPEHDLYLLIQCTRASVVKIFRLMMKPFIRVLLS